jgi:hypothetical protein
MAEKIARISCLEEEIAKFKEDHVIFFTTLQEKFNLF